MSNNTFAELLSNLKFLSKIKKLILNKIKKYAEKKERK